MPPQQGGSKGSAVAAMTRLPRKDDRRARTSALLWPMNRGVTLPELLVVVSLVALVLGIVAPRLSEPLDALIVEHAAGEIAGAHARARVAAVVESRITLLHVAPGQPDHGYDRPRGTRHGGGPCPGRAASRSS